jgi:FixJ family two-component response regulator
METVYIIDDDPSVRRSLARLVSLAGYREEVFDSGENFLAALPSSFSTPVCVIIDLQMPGIGGLDLQRQLNELNGGTAPCPMVFISGNTDIPATVEAMRQGAVTFLPKPFDDEDLLRAIAEGLVMHRGHLAESERTGEIRARIVSLSPREREVMAWVITGALNKQIAAELGIVEQTVKVHRARVMEKMGVISVAGLVRCCDAVGFETAGAGGSLPD